MESNNSFVLTARAQRDLDQVTNYISLELLNPSAATKFVESILVSLRGLCTFPESGTLVEKQFDNGYQIRKRISGNYIIYYGRPN